MDFDANVTFSEYTRHHCNVFPQSVGRFNQNVPQIDSLRVNVYLFYYILYKGIQSVAAYNDQSVISLIGKDRFYFSRQHWSGANILKQVYEGAVI